MNAELPATQLHEWGVRRLRVNRRALRGINELLRMSRHDGTIYLRPVTAHRTVVVFRPANRFLQTVIVQCGRTRISNGNGLGPPLRHFVLPVKHHTGYATLRICGSSTCHTERDDSGREWFRVDEPFVYVDVPEPEIEP